LPYVEHSLTDHPEQAAKFRDAGHTAAPIVTTPLGTWAGFQYAKLHQLAKEQQRTSPSAAKATPGLSAATACSGPPSVTGGAPSGGPTNSPEQNNAPPNTRNASVPHSNESRRTSERPPPRHPHRYRIHAHHLHRSNHQLRTEMDLLNEHHTYTFEETC